MKADQRPYVVVDDKIPFLRGVLEPFAQVAYIDGQSIGSEDVRHADAMIVRTRTRCDAGLLDGSAVRFIATATIGTDHIDIPYCESHGITWTNAAGCNAGSVYQYVAAALAWLASVHDFQFAKLTLGVVGCGHVGSKVAALGRIAGMNVIVNDPPLQRVSGGDFVSLHELLSRSDIVSLHTPLTTGGIDPTFHLIGQTELEMMKPGAVLINSSRGEVVDNESLKMALKQHVIKDAILDVWENEPEPDPDLIHLSALATPHIAGYSADGKATGSAMSVQALAAFFGFPLTGWQPETIPHALRSNLLSIDAQEKNIEQVFAGAVLHTYDIQADDARLRSNPGDFERQRGHYPVRREFHYYTIHLINGSAGMRDMLSRLGFGVGIQ
jgi:erythronate-4-phosphate dehydrogenase